MVGRDLMHVAPFSILLLLQPLRAAVPPGSRFLPLFFFPSHLRSRLVPLHTKSEFFSTHVSLYHFLIIFSLLDSLASLMFLFPASSSVHSAFRAAALLRAALLCAAPGNFRQTLLPSSIFYS